MKKPTINLSKIAAPASKLAQKRSVRYGAFSTVLTIIIIAAIVLVNIAATSLIKYFDAKIDLTADKLFSISAESSEYLKTVKNDIKITVLSTEESFANGSGQYANLYKHAYNVLTKYQAECPKIKIEYIDVYANPQIAANYPNDSLNQSDIIVESALRHKVISPNDIFSDSGATDEYGNATGGTTISTAEQSLTSAILFADDENPVSVGFTVSHRETTAPGFAALLRKNNYADDEIDLLKNNIPESMKIIVIDAPKADFAVAEIQALEKFLENGGEYGTSVVYTAYPDQGETPNLNAFLKEWGIAIDNSNVLYETDSNQIFYGSANLALAQVTFTDYTKTSYNFEGMRICMPLYVSPVEKLFETSGSKKTAPLVYSTNTSILQPINELTNGKWTGSGLPRTSYDVGVASTHELTAADGSVKKSNVYAFGSQGIFDDSLLEKSLFANAQFLLTIFANSTQKQDLVQIAPKTIETATLGASQLASDVLSFVFMWAVPLAVVVAGIVVFARRRKL